VGLPIAVPVVDLTTIGAGRSSIARFDKGGLLEVGLQSAGAEPGPAAYGRGGTDATVTDANLVLGRLNRRTSSVARSRSPPAADAPQGAFPT
jgi:N-methylhydantoinase A